TGNCADADPFVNIDNILYNEQGLKPIHRIHYMNYSSKDFARLCQGEDVNICYQDVFLHYRFFKNPEQKPQQLIPTNSLTKATRKLQKFVNKIKRTIS
ncbi:MAG TPA: methionine synthase, partial [Cyanothece sp. UBA12306]|nr:methionine synthase [Cyanothece sp. UBA12306]